MSVFTEPIKKRFSELFGDTMTKLFGGFYDSLVADSAKASASVIGDKTAEATAGATAGIVNQSNGDPYSCLW